MPSFAQPRRVTISMIDDDGAERVVIASRPYGRSANLPHWDLRLQHPSGQHWPGSFDGGNILDAMGEMLVRKEHVYNESRNRGHRVPQMRADRNISIGDDGNPIGGADLVTHQGHRVAFGRAAAAAARAQSERKR